MKTKVADYYTSQYNVAQVVAAPAGWMLVRIGDKSMELEPIAAFATGIETRYACWRGQPTKKKTFPGCRKRKLHGKFPVSGVLVFPGTGTELCSSIEWFGGEYDWLFDSMIAGIVPPGTSRAEAYRVYRQGVRQLKKYTTVQS